MAVRKVRNKDIFDSGAKTLVCPVNCVGVMGAGLALQIKKRYPACYLYYRKLCSNAELLPGTPVLWKNPKKNERNILLFPTKDLWTKPSEFKWIKSGLEYLVENQEDLGIYSICFPLLGAGCGNLPRDKVEKLMDCYLQKLTGFVSFIA